jgi:hypothetical protein
MKEFFNRNNFLFGLLLGMLTFGSTLTILLVLEKQIGLHRPGGIEIPFNIMLFVAIAVNLFPFRIYMVNWRYERTGRGILFATFILAFANILYIVLAQEGSLI